MAMDKVVSSRAGSRGVAVVITARDRTNEEPGSGIGSSGLRLPELHADERRQLVEARVARVDLSPIPGGCEQLGI
jgi:hypothetical protein